MGNILNVKNQGHFQIMLDKIKGNKEKRKAIITFERAPYVLLLLPPWNLLHMSFTQGSSSQKKNKKWKKTPTNDKIPNKKNKETTQDLLNYLLKISSRLHRCVKIFSKTKKLSGQLTEAP